MGISVYYKPAVAIGGQLASKTISSNGVYNAGSEGVYGFSQVTVAVPSAVLVSQIFSQNGSYSPSDFSAEGFSDITVNVPDTVEDLLVDNFQRYTLPAHIGETHELRPYAFAYMKNLEYVDMNNEDEVPSGCFYQCAGLKEVVGSKVDFFKNGENFYYCYRLERLAFPNARLAEGGTVKNCHISKGVNFNGLICCTNGSFFQNVQMDFSQLSFPNFIATYGGFINSPSNTIFSATGMELFCPKLLMVSTTCVSAYESCFSLISVPELVHVGSTFVKDPRLKEIYAPNLAFANSTLFSVNASNTFSILAPMPYLVHMAYASHFMNCNQLSQINAFVPSAAQNMFYGCSILQSLSIACSFIGTSAFYNCSSLSKIELYAFSATLSNVNAFTNTPMSDSTYLGDYGSVYVPGSRVEYFKSSTNWATFSDRIVALPSEYDSKYAYAFEFVRNDGVYITEIPSEKLNVERIFFGAFSTNLVRVPDLSFPNCSVIDDYAFYNNSRARQLSFPECVVIGCRAFESTGNSTFSTYSDAGLKTFYFPKAKYIGQGAFYGAKWGLNDSTIDLPECVFIGSSAFCQGNLGYNSSGQQVVNISINGPKVKYIGDNAFGSNYYINNFSFPEVEVIDGHAFSSTNLSQFSASKCVYVNDQAFSSCRNLQTLYLPNVIKMGAQDINVYNTMTSINLDNLKWLGRLGGIKISHISLPKLEYLMSISAFASATFVEIRLSRIGYLPDWAFYNCTALSKAFFDNVGSMSTNCFYNCTKLESLYFAHHNMVSAEYSIYNMPSTAGGFLGTNNPFFNSTYLTPNRYGSIYVPAALLSDYQNDSIWGQISERFVGLTDEEFQNVLDHWDD